MRFGRAWAAWILVIVAGCTAPMVGEDLGGGFRRVAVPVTNGEETSKQSPSEHLYFNGEDLGRVSFLSVAPSSSYAIFERNHTLFIIESETGRLRPVTGGDFFMPRRAHWSEEDGFVEVEAESGAPRLRIELRSE